ncbi:MAG: EamA family transporter, partial [Candidatus Nanopelagicaceae bacterium]
MAAILALLSSLLWGSADFLGGTLSKRHRAFAVTGLSQVFGLLVGLIAMVVTGAYLAPTLALDGFFVSGAIAGVAGLIGLISLYSGLATGRMGVVAPISALSALVPLAIAYIEGERVNALQVLGMAVALAGAFMASGPELRGASIRPILLGLSAAIFFGISLTFLWQGSKLNPLLTMVSMRIASVSIVISVAVAFRNRGSFTKRDMPALLFIGSADFLANLTLGIATTKGLASVAFVLGSLFPIVTALLAFGIHKERLLKVQYFGILAAVAG